MEWNEEHADLILDYFKLVGCVASYYGYSYI